MFCTTSTYVLIQVTQIELIITKIPNKPIITYPIELVVEATWITDRVPIVVPSPENSLCSLTVTAFVVDTLQVGLLQGVCVCVLTGT